jgi:hypothetical protein
MPLDIHSPRSTTYNSVVTVRKTINLVDFSNSTTLLLASIPINSFITSAACSIVTAFNAATTNVLTLGVTQASANELLAAADITEGTPGYYTQTTGCGTINTQTAQPAISNIDVTQGGVGLWVKFTQTGTAATTGQAVVAVTYIPPIEG